MAKAVRTGIQARGGKKNNVDGIPAGDLSQYIATRQAAELLGVTRFQVFHLITAKRIQAVKLGHDWLVLASSVEKYYKTKSPRGRPAMRKPRLQETN